MANAQYSALQNGGCLHRPVCLLGTKPYTFDRKAAVVSVWSLLKAVVRASQTIVAGSGLLLPIAANLSRISDIHSGIDGWERLQKPTDRLLQTCIGPEILSKTLAFKVAE